MLLSNQIRIGNLIINKAIGEDPVPLTREDFQNPEFWTDMEANAEGVPLDQDWLKDFGFVSYKENLGWKIDLNAETSLFLEGASIYKVFIALEQKSDTSEPDLTFIGLTSIQYVHQLQNLFIDLTGEDLKIATA